jgi:photosystem II stability/assembly factor-like uncharacterized protein
MGPVCAQDRQSSGKPAANVFAEPLGLYKSEDGGDSWTDIANGVPSDFGFAMEIDPHDAECVYICRLSLTSFAVRRKGSCAFIALRMRATRGRQSAMVCRRRMRLETVLRDGLSADDMQPTGIYFGTRNGKLFGSTDSGESWNAILESLPPVVCVKAAVVN